MADETAGPSPEERIELVNRTIERALQTPGGTLSVRFERDGVEEIEEGGAPLAGGQTTPVQRSATANGGSPAPLVGDGTDGSFFNQLQGVPIDYLIATPLISSARANLALASVMTEFIDEIAFKDNKTRLVEFDLTREIQDPVTKKFSPQTIKVQAPLLALVPIPALLIQSVTIDLTVEISQTFAQSNSSTTSAQLQVGADWGWGNASFTGSYSNTESSTRSTNQSAKYQVTVNAQQQPVPEGMSRLMDVFASTITPIPAAAS